MKTLLLYSSSANNAFGVNNMVILGLFVLVALIFMFSQIPSKSKELEKELLDYEEDEQDAPEEFKRETEQQEIDVPVYKTGDERTLITLMTFTYPHEMSIIAAMLDSEGIEVFGKDEMTINANPLMSNMIGGVKLQVWSPDAERAVLLLKQAGYLKK